RPEAVDEALTRPGRFDRLVEVPLPSRDGRRAIFELHLKKSQRLAGRAVFEPLDEGGWERLLVATEGYSGADIAEAVRRALESKVRSRDRKSTRLNSSHLVISYAVFCLKKKK